MDTGNPKYKESDTQSFYANFFISPPPPPRENQPSSSDVKTQLTHFSQIPQNPPRTLPVHDVIYIPRSHFTIWDFYFDISEWHILPARAWTPALMLHLTNLCTKRKVLSLTKPKSKIYKTKSLGHYITLFCLRLHGGLLLYRHIIHIQLYTET